MWQPSGLLRAAHLAKSAAYAMGKATDCYSIELTASQYFQFVSQKLLHVS